MKKNKVIQKLPNPHFVCMACRFEATEKIKCPTTGCPRHRNLLGECNCKDGKHKEIPRLGPTGYPIEVSNRPKTTN